MVAPIIPCSIDGCDRKKYAFGYCAMHYKRHRNGREMSVPIARERRPNGGGSYSRGYHVVMDNGKVRAEHTIIAEQALGRPLKDGEQVHHWNKNRSDNRHENLLICTSSYHRLIHARMNALDACGHADWRKCIYCKQYSPINKFYQNAAERHGIHMHPACSISYQTMRKRSKPRAY